MNAMQISREELTVCLITIVVLSLVFVMQLI